MKNYGIYYFYDNFERLIKEGWIFQTEGKTIQTKEEFLDAIRQQQSNIQIVPELKYMLIQVEGGR